MKRPLLYDLITKIQWHYGKFYMKYVPGVVIKVRWPVGWFEIKKNLDCSVISGESADPNDHYRPWMEKYVGRQGIDWQWDVLDNDVAHNKLSIKFRKGKEKYASLAAIQWS